MPPSRRDLLLVIPGNLSVWCPFGIGFLVPRVLGYRPDLGTPCPAASGDIRALAVSGDERVPALPDVPSSKEASVFVPLTSWNSLSGPPGISGAIVRRLDEAVVKIIKRPDYVYLL